MLVDGNVWIGILPEREEVLIGGTSSLAHSRIVCGFERIGASQPQGGPGHPRENLQRCRSGGLYGYGGVWKLSPSSDGGWTCTDLYDFTGDEGVRGPFSSVAVTGPGRYLYGSTMYGGTNDLGVIYQINLGSH